MSLAQRLARLDRLDSRLRQLESTTVVQGMPVVLLSSCSCPVCSFRKSTYAGSGDALVVQLGCPAAIPPPIELPSDEERHDELTTADLPPTPPPRRPGGKRMRLGRFVVAN